MRHGKAIKIMMVCVCISAPSCRSPTATTQAGHDVIDKRLPALAPADVPIAAIYADHLGTLLPPTRPGARDPQVIVVIWPDGRVVWSPDPLEGGPPYHEGKADPNRISQKIGELRAAWPQAEPALRTRHFGPDSSFTVIRVANGEYQVAMASWHEFYERNPNVVDTADGLTSLDGRDRSAVLGAEPEDYKRFRRAWADFRAALTSLIPNEGKPLGDRHFVLRAAGN